MYKLTEKAQNLLLSDKNVRREVARHMGVSESAIYMSIKSDVKRKGEGRSIAGNYDAVNYLINTTGMTEAEIRVPIEQLETVTA